MQETIPVVKQRTIQHFGWRRDLPDRRDFSFYPAPSLTEKLPAKVDLRPNFDFPIYNQGQLGSCTANAIGAAVQYEMHKQGQKDWTPSRLFIYFNERLIEGNPWSDSGAQIRDGMKVVNQLGYPPEEVWPYAVNQFAVRPSLSVYTRAHNTRVTQYLRVYQDVGILKSCLASGFPFVGGITVYSSFPQTGNWGVVPMPGPDDSVEGGHALIFVGYDDGPKTFTFRNSWGPDWGNGGYGTIPYDYLHDPNLSADFWTVRMDQA